jgi:transglutaminase-like putative cysteine protease
VNPRRRTILGCALGAISRAGADDRSGAAPAAGWTRRNLRFTLAFSNPLARLLRNQRCWTYLPRSDGVAQILVETRVGMPHRIISDALGHQILELRFDEFPAFGQRLVTLNVAVDLKTEAVATALADPSIWLANARYLQLDDPAIRELAKQLIRNSPADTSRAIYVWVANQITYAGYIADELGAAVALRDRRGDCTEFADLAVALARNCAIPARTVGGYVSAQDFTPRPTDYHDWAEFYFDGGWCLVDCQKQRWLMPVDQYLGFRIANERAINPVGSASRYRIDGELTLSF